MARRRRRKATRGRPGRRIMFRVLAGVVVLVAVAAVVGYLKLRAYLQSDGFREFLAGKAGEVLHSEAVFEPFRWDGLQVHCEGFEASGGPMVKRLRADGLRTEVSLGGVRRGVWILRGASVRRVDFELAGGELPPFVKAADVGGWLPRRVELEDLRIDEAVLSGGMGNGSFTARGQTWRVTPGSKPGAYDFVAHGGTIGHPLAWFPDPEVVQARFRVQDRRLYLRDAEARVYGPGRLHLTGEAAFEEKEYTFEGSVRGVRGDRVLPEDWQKRLTGDLGADFTVRGRDGRVSTRGKIGMKDGVLTALPALDRLAAYADTQRFRVVNLTEARVDFFVEEGILRLTDVRIGSEGLIRIVGTMEVVDGRLDGRFRLGMAPGSLARIPGAETKVFVERREGLMWAPLRITGTVDDPKEDLSERLIAAAGERMFEVLPETGVKVLKFTRSAISDGAGVMLDGAPGAVDGGVDVLREAGGIVRDVGGGLFDLLPGRDGDAAPDRPRRRTGDLVEEPEGEEPDGGAAVGGVAVGGAAVGGE